MKISTDEPSSTEAGFTVQLSTVDECDQKTIQSIKSLREADASNANGVSDSDDGDAV